MDRELANGGHTWFPGFAGHAVQCAGCHRSAAARNLLGWAFMPEEQPSEAPNQLPDPFPPLSLPSPRKGCAAGLGPRSIGAGRAGASARAEAAAGCGGFFGLLLTRLCERPLAAVAGGPKGPLCIRLPPASANAASPAMAWPRQAATPLGLTPRAVAQMSDPRVAAAVRGARAMPSQLIPSSSPFNADGAVAADGGLPGAWAMEEDAASSSSGDAQELQELELQRRQRRRQAARPAPQAQAQPGSGQAWPGQLRGARGPASLSRRRPPLPPVLRSVAAKRSLYSA